MIPPKTRIYPTFMTACPATAYRVFVRSLALSRPARTEACAHTVSGSSNTVIITQDKQSYTHVVLLHAPNMLNCRSSQQTRLKVPLSQHARCRGLTARCLAHSAPATWASAMRSAAATSRVELEP